MSNLVTNGAEHMREDTSINFYFGTPPKIRTIRGPSPLLGPQHPPFPLVNGVSSLYHQQTKNLLVSYSPKKPGFFQATVEGL
ncbi:hypothetical protein OG905_05015 [Streptomyces sp. NBC_00322]|uniref:hypothetical protein n=1 Tax=Streptomyces sp. NBC_00322 TaxID=2975712 RepID=UPI002E2C5EBE|nr:hypothetical protein [Streptomyces sp. NBC_00322]